jgi:hypothetical protein
MRASPERRSLAIAHLAGEAMMFCQTRIFLRSQWNINHSSALPVLKNFNKLDFCEFLDLDVEKLSSCNTGNTVITSNLDLNQPDILRLVILLDNWMKHERRTT